MHLGLSVGCERWNGIHLFEVGWPMWYSLVAPSFVGGIHCIGEADGVLWQETISTLHFPYRGEGGMAWVGLPMM